MFCVGVGERTRVRVMTLSRDGKSQEQGLSKLSRISINEDLKSLSRKPSRQALELLTAQVDALSSYKLSLA